MLLKGLMQNFPALQPADIMKNYIEQIPGITGKLNEEQVSEIVQICLASIQSDILLNHVDPKHIRKSSESLTQLAVEEEFKTFKTSGLQTPSYQGACLVVKYQQPIFRDENKDYFKTSSSGSN